ncbi:putative proton-dependent oligopeptide transporter family, MFS transporter superfamily [Dioscorea sansibarensis]
MAGMETKQSLRKGGFRATMFIFFMTGFENIGFVANMVSMVLYFLLGYILAIIQAHRPSLRPPGQCLTCKLEGKNAAIFYLSLCLLALGFGGIRGAYPALGGDQFDKNNPKERKGVASFFNWLLMSITLGATLGVTVIVWVSTDRSWALGFFIAMICAILGFCIITAGKPFYRVRIVKDSPLTRLFQVMVAAIRNRKLSLPENTDELYQQYTNTSSSNNDNEKAEDEEIIPHSTQFRWLDKAAIILPRSSTSQIDPWRVCTVSQVEELKIVIRVLPILASTILMNTCLAQLQTFTVQQGNIMDLHLGSFEVPAASIPVIPLIFMSALVPAYEFIFIPLVRRFTRQPNGITTLQRVGVGLVLSAISMAIGALIEVKRRDAFNNHGKRISLFWLSFQYGVFGIADMFTFVGLMDFFYGEAPAGLRSLSTSFSWLSLSLGYFLSTVLVRVVNSVTAKGTTTGHGWLYGIDLNKNRLDLFYWFLAILSCLNFVLYLLCAKWYKYRKDMGTHTTTVGGHDRRDEHGKVELLSATPSTVAIYPSPAPSSVSMYSPMTLETRELIRP